VSVRVGVLAPADHHFEGYAELLAGDDDVEFVGVADDDAERGRAAAGRHGVEYLPTEDLLARADGVVVFSTYAERARWIEPAADAGVAVLCEKPLATSVAEARRLVERCERGGVPLGMLMPLRFGEPMRRAKALVTDGAVGDVELVIGRNRCAFRNRDVEGWTTDPGATGGGGSVVHHSEHLVDAVRWITGEEFVEVYAELGHQRGLEVEDANVVSATLSDGTAFTLDTSWTTPDEDEFVGDAEFEIVGTEGTLAVDNYGEALRVVRDGAGDDAGVEKRYFGPSGNEALLRDFLEAVETGGTTAATGRDGLRQVEVIEGVYESDRTGGPVPLEQ